MVAPLWLVNVAAPPVAELKKSIVPSLVILALAAVLDPLNWIAPRTRPDLLLKITAEPALAFVLKVSVPVALLVIRAVPADAPSKKSITELLVMLAVPAELVSKNCRMLLLLIVAL